VRDWRDHPAWSAFFERYNPLLHHWCRRFALGSDDADELCQRIWIELMARMRSFRYDPTRGFRGWLWRLFRSRAIDVLRHRRTTLVATSDVAGFEQSGLANLPRLTAREDDGADRESAPPLLLLQAAEAQEAVRSRLDPDTWRAYWMIAIDDRSVRETATALGKNYTAVYNGYKRVDRMLRQEGQRRLALLAKNAPQSRSLNRSP
jgi:RNA polymerase sigma-70 factor (ECF subfamily)